MTWEETICSIRKNSDFSELVNLCYFESDLRLNVERFSASKEWHETLQLIGNEKKQLRILDVGCGNGIASVAFAFQNHMVVALDPDPSETVGTGAVLELKRLYNLDNLEVRTGYAETINLPIASFDLVYCRQAMHHANSLNQFVLNCCRFLKKGGLMLTVRDHVIWSERDKKWFLDTHPLHKFYGGENAFTPKEYEKAFIQSNLEIIKVIKHFESVINFYPQTKDALAHSTNEASNTIKKRLQKEFGRLGNLSILYWLYTKLIFDPADITNENKVPGRMYTYLAKKK